MPLLSIIVPIYNAASTLSATLDSLRKQSFEDVEFILVDDGSTDTSLEICHAYSSEDQRFKVFTQENSGVSVARNNGLDNASGEYIGFVDSDDTVKPEMFARLIEAIIVMKADMAMGGYEKIFDGQVQSIITLPNKGLITGDDVTNISWSMAFWGGYRKSRRLPTLYGSTWPNLYRNKIIKENDIRFPVGVSIGEDLLFNLQYLKVSTSVIFVNQSLYCYNTGNSSATRCINPKLLDKYLEILNYADEILNVKQNIEFETNFHRQILSYAINVIEEQGHLCQSWNDKISIAKNVCMNTEVLNSGKFILKNGVCMKERIQALLFVGRFYRILTYLLAR